MLGAKTVKELIEKLQELPADAKIGTYHLNYEDPVDCDFCAIETPCIVDAKGKILYVHVNVCTPLIDSGHARLDESFTVKQ